MGLPAPRGDGGVEYCMELGMLGTEAAPPCKLSNGDGSICELSMCAPVTPDSKPQHIFKLFLECTAVGMYPKNK